MRKILFILALFFGLIGHSQQYFMMLKQTTAGPCTDSIHIEAEAFTTKSSTVFTGGGCDPANVGGTDINDWNDPAEYVSFNVTVACTGTYRIKMRTTGGSSTFTIKNGIGGTTIATIIGTSAYFCDYKTDESTVSLTAGSNTLTFYSSAAQGFNWFELVK